MEDNFLSAIFGESEFRPVKKNGITIPHYFVSKDGRILSTKTKKHKILEPKYTQTMEGYKKPHLIGMRVDKREVPELFADYDYGANYTDTDHWKKKKVKRTNKNVRSVQMQYHRVVMEAWKPIDEYPPDRLKDCWNIIPPEAKQFIKECVIIDHEDSDTRNNHVDNLRWCTHLENQHDRKGGKGHRRKKYQKRGHDPRY